MIATPKRLRNILYHISIAVCFMPRGVLRISSDQGMIEWEQKSRPTCKKKPLGLPTKPKKYPCTKH